MDFSVREAPLALQKRDNGNLAESHHLSPEKSPNACWLPSLGDFAPEQSFKREPCSRWAQERSIARQYRPCRNVSQQCRHHLLNISYYRRFFCFWPDLAQRQSSLAEIFASARRFRQQENGFSAARSQIQIWRKTAVDPFPQLPIYCNLLTSPAAGSLRRP